MRRSDAGATMDGRPTGRMTGRRVAARLRAVLEDGAFEALGALFTADALLDANLPSWRLQRQGPEAIRRQMEEWFPEAPAQFTEWRVRDTAWGAVVECVERKADGGEEVLFREVFLLFTEGDRIAGFTLYCTGAWDAATRERHAREAPMVRSER